MHWFLARPSLSWAVYEPSSSWESWSNSISTRPLALSKLILRCCKRANKRSWVQHSPAHRPTGDPTGDSVTNQRAKSLEHLCSADKIFLSAKTCKPTNRRRRGSSRPSAHFHSFYVGRVECTPRMLIGLWFVMYGKPKGSNQLNGFWICKPQLWSFRNNV